MKPCSHPKTAWCACTKHAPKLVTYRVVSMAGIPFDKPILFKAPPNATPRALELAASDAIIGNTEW